MTKRGVTLGLLSVLFLISIPLEVNGGIVTESVLEDCSSGSCIKRLNLEIKLEREEVINYEKYGISLNLERMSEYGGMLWHC